AMRHSFRRPASQAKHECVAALVFDAGLISIRIDCLSCLIEIFCADVERLMNVTNIVREQNNCDRPSDLARIIFRDFVAQTSTQYEIMWTMSHRMRPVFPSEYFSRLRIGTSV